MLHFRTERAGKPIVVALTAGQWHERSQALPLLEQGVESVWPKAVAGDTGYSAASLSTWPQDRDSKAVIPYREDESGPQAHDRDLYRERSVIERVAIRLTRYPRVATRSVKTARSSLAMVTIACILEWV